MEERILVEGKFSQTNIPAIISAVIALLTLLCSLWLDMMAGHSLKTKEKRTFSGFASAGGGSGLLAAQSLVKRCWKDVSFFFETCFYLE